MNSGSPVPTDILRVLWLWGSVMVELCFRHLFTVESHSTAALGSIVPFCTLFWLCLFLIMCIALKLPCACVCVSDIIAFLHVGVFVYRVHWDILDRRRGRYRPLSRDVALLHHVGLLKREKQHLCFLLKFLSFEELLKHISPHSLVE